MNPETEKTMAFFGKMTANLTHEFKNILAIIQESAGLMEDIMAISPLSKEKYQDRFNNSMATIKNQLHRGMQLAARFNKFAHAPDQTNAQMDLDETIDHFCTLTERFARLKNISLQAGKGTPPGANLTTNPVLFYMALFYGLESCLAVLPANTSISIAPAEKNGRQAVEIVCSGPQAPSADEFSDGLRKSDSWNELEDAAGQLEAEIECETRNLCLRLIFK
ncbi:MAG: hypothetical protein ACQETG_00795 [Thermodesulfobacteriota bacterium]